MHTVAKELTDVMARFLQDKKKIFDKQQKVMKKRNSSFLDSIRMEVENDEDF